MQPAPVSDSGSPSPAERHPSSALDRFESFEREPKAPVSSQSRAILFEPLWKSGGSMNRAIQPRETMLEIVSISIPILALIVGSPAPVDGRTIVPDLEIAEPVGQTWLDYARPPIGTLGAEEGATQRVPGDTLTFGFVDDDGLEGGSRLPDGDAAADVGAHLGQ